MRSELALWLQIVSTKIYILVAIIRLLFIPLRSIGIGEPPRYASSF